MYNFYPGPSKIYPKIKDYLTEGMDSGLLEMNHRSGPFMELLAETIRLFKEKMLIPDDYEVFFTSSATECWEILAQSVLRGRIQFLYSGAFGKKWFKYTVTNPVTEQSGTELPTIRGTRFFLEQNLSEAEIDLQAQAWCLVQNETSNGTAVSLSELKKLPDHGLRCFDITSSLAGQYIDFSLGDCWLASVQKCLGLPAGLGLLICSPRAISKAMEVNERNHYNSLLFIKENFDKNQTHYTPNILAIYLLNRLMKDLPGIRETDAKITRRAADLYQFFEEETAFKPLVKNPETRSKTVLTLTCPPNLLDMLKQKAAENKITLGNGYGEWKDSSFRIANFPAIEDHEYTFLKEFITASS